ncbi:MAG: tetratricopeptide repeat protein [Promethearchaeota archaeon]
MAAEINERTQFDWFGVARIHETNGDYEEALKAYEESIKLDDTFAKAWFYKAKLHYMLDQIQEARECVERVLELEPDWEKYVKRYMPDL